MEELVMWLEDNTTVAMMAIIAIIAMITFIYSIVIGKKRNKAIESSIARGEGEKAAEIAFAQKAEIALSIESSFADSDRVNDLKADDITVAVNEKGKSSEEKESIAPVTVKSGRKKKTPPLESTFSPRKKSITIIDPEYVTPQKEVRTKTIITSDKDSRQ